MKFLIQICDIINFDVEIQNESTAILGVTGANIHLRDRSLSHGGGGGDDEVDDGVRNGDSY